VGDEPAHGPGPAEEGGGPGDIPFLQSRTDQRRGDGLALPGKRRDDGDGNADREAMGLQHLGRAGAALAEVEIVAADEPPRAQSGDEQIVDKAFRGDRGDIAIERQHEDLGEACLRQPFELELRRGQPEDRLLRPEDAARMRLEGEGGRPGAEIMRHGTGHPRQLGMAAMHAVEIAERQHGAAQAVGDGLVEVEDHGRRLWARRRIGLGWHRSRMSTCPDRRATLVFAAKAGGASRPQAGRGAQGRAFGGIATQASPSITALPSTRHSQKKRARRRSATSSTTSTRAVTTSPIFTGARKVSVCER